MSPLIGCATENDVDQLDLAGLAYSVFVRQSQSFTPAREPPGMVIRGAATEQHAPWAKEYGAAGDYHLLS